MGREHVGRADTGHGWLPRNCWNIRSLLVRATFGERTAGILVLQSGKRSSENGFQTTFGVVGKGSSLEDRVRAYRTHSTHRFQVLRDL